MSSPDRAASIRFGVYGPVMGRRGGSTRVSCRSLGHRPGRPATPMSTCSKHSAPGPPASRTRRPAAVLVAADDQSPGAEVAGEVGDARRGSRAGRASAFDARRRRQPDREVGDDRADCCPSGIAGRGHLARRGRRSGARCRASWPPNDGQQDGREQQRAADRQRRRRARRPGSSSPGAGRPRRSARSSASRADDRPAGRGPGRRRGGTCPRSSRPGRAGS